MIDIERDGVAAVGVTAGATEGECALGRLIRFSTVYGCQARSERLNLSANLVVEALALSGAR